MTLIPVSNIWARGSRVSKAGASRWISQRSSTGPMSSVSRDSPRTLKTWPSVASPTGTDSPRPRLRTGAPRVRPSVAFRQTQRTRPSPICCATSAVTVTFEPSSSRSISTAMLISGNACGGNSTSTTGPAIATTRPSGRAPLPVVTGSVVVVVMLCFLVGVGGLAQGLCAADDLHDLGGDGVLACPVHDAGQGLRQIVGVVGGGGHGPLAGSVLTGRRFEQGAEDLSFHVTRHELHEQVR